MNRTHVIVYSVVISLAIIAIIEFRTRRRQRNRKVDSALSVLKERAYSCDTDALDALSLDVAYYASDLVWNTRKQKKNITAIIYFINGRQRQFRKGLIDAARARSQGTAAPPPGQSSH